MRPLSKLDEIPVNQWTEEEAAAHLAATFEDAAREFPDMMDPYANMLPDASAADRIEIMQRGLRETVRRRYTSPSLASLIKAGIA